MENLNRKQIDILTKLCLSEIQQCNFYIKNLTINKEKYEVYEERYNYFDNQINKNIVRISEITKIIEKL